MDGSESPDFSSANAGFWGANVLLALQSAPCNLPQERYNLMKPVPKKEIPIQ
jgi:hypothetical protein